MRLFSLSLGLFFLLFIVPVSAAPNRVSINSDQTLEVNGRKIFPVGVTMPPPIDGLTPEGKNGLQELADAGVTFMRTGASGGDWTEQTVEREQQWMDAAARHGLYCWPFLRELGSVSNDHPRREELLRKVITRFRDHPGLLAWKGADEPEWGKLPLEPLIKARELIHELDPNHPLVIIHAPRGTVQSLRVYNNAADIIGMDIYPIGYPPGQHSLLTNKTISLVGDHTRITMEAAEGKLPVWMVLQIAWSGVIKPGKTLRFPTFAEERFMTYESIINGARGLNYFGGNLQRSLNERDARLGWNWTYWERVLKAVVLEVGSKSPLQSALVAPNSKLPIKCNDPGLELCVRETGGAIFILACKRDGVTREARFNGLPSDLSSGEVMFEFPRKVNCPNGNFSDWFAPYEVHVYRFGPEPNKAD